MVPVSSDRTDLESYPPQHPTVLILPLIFLPVPFCLSFLPLLHLYIFGEFYRYSDTVCKGFVFFVSVFDNYLSLGSLKIQVPQSSIDSSVLYHFFHLYVRFEDFS